tara:strand:- start:217 stop:765 length:549 start_codon:yes stop_codon:yes gene_type:complete
MATAKTGTFYLTETVELAPALAAGTIVQGTLDLSAYVNVPTGQAIAVDQVDFVVQNGPAFSGSVASMLAANGSITFQLTDLNPGTLFVRADNQSLIASGCLNIDAINNISTHTTDLFPDNFGPTSLSESFMVVNDTLYLTGGNNGAAVGGATLSVSVRARCRVVKLGTKDWMAIAIQSTAEA